ncbi:hypothetical protein C8A05DRAFT_34713 [Staphylotrichum tortipilum]|uniref:SET domain-containing protein n=1 Tax=Staphylotrichum tortipilum TaxID=2831512 RepID=A0AAN6MK01_9PEZI|nr:hypothetical protein C8A05DRAFT_34713 [Staphylotrichum longicolle]
MSALRQRAALLARMARPVRPFAVSTQATRSYGASHDHHGDHHHHEAPHNVEEPLGTGIFLLIAVVLGSAGVYHISRPHPNGEPTEIHKWLERVSNSYAEDLESKSQLLAAAIEQAAHDRHLLYGVQRTSHYDLRYPEVFAHGSPYNVPAGHYPNIDHVVAHYKQKYHEEEVRKANKLAAAAAAAAQAEPSHFLSRAPLNLPAVRIGFVSPAVGYGLFAARDLAQDEFVFHEAPLMTARFNEAFAADKALVQSQAAACRAALAARPEVTAAVFPGLALRFAGVLPAPYDDVERVLDDPAEMGRNLVAGHGQFTGCTVTREQYEAYTIRLVPAAAQPPPSQQPDADARRDACLTFFKNYAFQAPPSSSSTTTPSTSTSPSRPPPLPPPSSTSPSTATTRQASIYLLASLINHRCTPSHPSSPNTSSSSSGSGPNCTWRIGPSGLAHFVRPGHICVQARRPIRAGEQLTWDYGKREKGFACECDTCRLRLRRRGGGLLMGGLGASSSCKVL